jgi:hypothetical protein
MEPDPGAGEPVATGGAGGSLGGTPVPGPMATGGAAPPAGTGGTGGTGSTGGAAVMPDASRPPDMTPPMPAPTPPAQPPGPSPMSVALFDESKVIDLFLTFPPGEWEKLLNLQMNEDDTRWARCSFTFEGSTYPEAHCRRKGTPELWRGEKKPQMIVRFNFLNKQGRFRGLRRLNLEYYDELAAPIRDRIGMWAMREAGLDAPRVNHARVFKDGAFLGLYQNIEAVDKEFLEDHFGPAASNGNLWESGWDLKTNEDMPNQARLEALKALIEREPLTGDHAAFYQQLDAMMDIDEVLLELAAETAILTDDNFSNGAENYFYYDHPQRGFLVLPWDVDTIFSAPAESSIWNFYEPAPNKLRELINQNATWRALYAQKLVDIRDRVLARMPAKAKAVCDQIRNYVYADPNRRPSFAEFEEECAWLHEEAMPERIESIRKQLGGR